MSDKIDSAKNVNQLIAMLEVGTCLTVDELQALKGWPPKGGSAVI